MAGMAGLEPANAGVKVPCLTTWLHPSIAGEARAGADAPALSHNYGVGNGARTHDTRNHNPVLCQLSYTHHMKFSGTPEGTRTPDPLLRRQLLYPPELQAHIMNGAPAKPSFRLRGERRDSGVSELSRLRGSERYAACLDVERVMGIEPTRPAWKAGILPLNYTRRRCLRKCQLEYDTTIPAACQSPQIKSPYP